MRLATLTLALLSVSLSAQESTYYVGPTAGECDGHRPDCPLSMEQAISQRLFEGSSRRIEFRAGTYALPQGLVINGTGTNERSRLILAAYQGEQAIFDGLATSPAATGPRELLRVSGAYVTVQGLTLRNSRGYLLEVRGAREVNILGNHFEKNVASDALKGDGGARQVNVIGNTFTAWDSQAIDMAGVRYWLVQYNTLFDPAGEKAGPIGIKLGSSEIRVLDNTIRNTAGSLDGGGTSDPHPESYEATNITVARNQLTNIKGMAFEFYSCDGCKAEDNLVDGAWGGVRMRGGVSGCAGGCKPSRAVVVTGNRFRRLNGGPEREAVPDVFALIEPSEVGSVVFSKNTYCGAAAQFYQGRLLDWLGWRAVMPSDGGSSVLGATACQ